MRMVSKNSLKDSLSPLQVHRLHYLPNLPLILQDLTYLVPVTDDIKAKSKIKSKIQNIDQLSNLFPHTASQSIIHFKKENTKFSSPPIKVGVVLSGGQAPGGHNVIAGLYDALKKINPQSSLIGFRDGPSGIVKNKTIEIEGHLLELYRNQGGFDIIGTGRSKIETPEQFAATEATMLALDLDGLVIIGGDDSNTNAAVLAEYFKERKIKTRVVGVPKTIDGDLQNEYIDIPFGFDTACKVYSEIISNILKDALSANKYYFFIKLMGRSASHITLECALQTHVNMALISEEVEEKKLSLQQLVEQIADMICQRADKGKNHGAVLIPEGIIEFIPEFKNLIKELNILLAMGQVHVAEIEKFEKLKDKVGYLSKFLSPESLKCTERLPEHIQTQLLLDRDAHGNIQVSKIETERLFIELVEKELRIRQKEGRYKEKFAPQPLFCGYEARCSLPSNFDCKYCYALGYVATLLIYSGLSGYMSCIMDLQLPVDQWKIAGVPIFDMLHMENRGDKSKPVIKKALVDLKGKPFALYASQREGWMLDDNYRCPGPIQFEGPSNITDTCPIIIS